MCQYVMMLLIANCQVKFSGADVKGLLLIFNITRNIVQYTRITCPCKSPLGAII